MQANRPARGGNIVPLFGGRGSEQEGDVLAQLDRIRVHVVQPIVEKIELQLEAVRSELRSQGERMERSQSQNERAQEQTHALIRSLTDPETGSFTRIEMRMLKESADLIHANLDGRIGKIERAEEGTILHDHEKRLREREKPVNVASILGMVTGIITILTAFGLLATGHLIPK